MATTPRMFLPLATGPVRTGLARARARTDAGAPSIAQPRGT